MNTIEQTIEMFRDEGLALPPRNFHMRIPNAMEVLNNVYTALFKYKGEEFKDFDEMYDLAEWLTDNKGKGLLLIGNCGRGKTFFAKYVFPLILRRYYQREVCMFDAYSLNKSDIENLSKFIMCYIVIDDIGVEDVKSDYGTKYNPVDEILDMAEKKGFFVVLTTNLGGKELEQKYGTRVFDRMLKLCHRIYFDNDKVKSFRDDRK